MAQIADYNAIETEPLRPRAGWSKGLRSSGSSLSSAATHQIDQSSIRREISPHGEGANQLPHRIRQVRPGFYASSPQIDTGRTATPWRRLQTKLAMPVPRPNAVRSRPALRLRGFHHGFQEGWAQSGGLTPEDCKIIWHRSAAILGLRGEFPLQE